MPVRGRILSASLATSRKFSRLQTNDHRLMYVMLIPHVDCEGRHDAEPAVLAGKCFTTLGYGPDDIEVALGDMCNHGLISLYEAHGDMFLEIVDFHVHQNIRRKKDGNPQFEAPSRIPPPPDRRKSEGARHPSGATGVETREYHGGTTEVPPLHKADQSKVKEVKVETLTGSLPTTENQAPVAERRPRPGGRVLPAAVTNYLNRRPPPEKTDAEVAVDRLVNKPVEA